MRTEDSKYNLPPGWCIATIKDLVSENESFFKDGDWIESKDQNPSGKVRLIQLADIGDGEFKDKSNRYMTLTQAKELNCTFLEKGDILVARMPEPLGRACVFPLDGKYKFVTVVDVAIIRTDTDEVDNRFLMTFINTPQFRVKIKALQSGSTRKRISRNNLGSIDFPLPPIREQIRIVSKVDSLLSELENGIHHLKLCQKQLEVYRQALLKEAFEGKLTEKWRSTSKPESAEMRIKQIREERKSRYEQELTDWKIALKEWEENSTSPKPRKPVKPVEYPKLNKEDLKKLPIIPESWMWVRNNDLLYYVTSGSRNWKKYYSNHGSYFIRTQDIKTNKLELDNVSYVDLPEKVEGKRSLVEKGDLLMTITGANVGRIAIIDREIPEAYVSQSVALMKPVDPAITPYLHYYFQSDTFGSRMINEMVYGVGRPVLSLENMREVAVAVPGLKEQKIIVNELESQFSIIEKLKNEVSDGITKIEICRQSILKKAYEGTLVEQNNKDESAFEILKRIKAEKKKYLDNQRALKQKQPKRIKKMSKTRNIKEVLQSSDEPMMARDVWQQSEHKEDIEKFYSELKKIKNNVKQVKEGTQSLLSLRS